MLVLNRKVEESINIGPNIEIKVLDCRRARVRLGISAPDSVDVWRSELARTADNEANSGHRETPPQLSVLLIEDDEISARGVKRILAKEGNAKVHVCLTADEAVELLWNENAADESPVLFPQLLLLDLNLPGRISGVEFLLKLKSDPRLRRIPVVVLSGSDCPDEIDECLDFGANAYVTKPVNYDQYGAIVLEIARFWGRNARVSETHMAG